MSTKQKKTTYVTPAGVARFPKLNEPDYEFKEEGEYSVQLILTPDETEPLLKKLKPLHDEAVKKGKAADQKRKPAARKKNPFSVNALFEEEYDSDDQPTGNYIFKFSTKASGVSKKTGKKWERRVPVYDTVRKPVDLDTVQIWGGSILKVAFTAGEYFINGSGAAGLKLYLEAAQVIELVSGGGSRSAGSFGFNEEEGYEFDGEKGEDTPFDPDGEDAGEEDTGQDDGPEEDEDF